MNPKMASFSGNLFVVIFSYFLHDFWRRQRNFFVGPTDPNFRQIKIVHLTFLNQEVQRCGRFILPTDRPK